MTTDEVRSTVRQLPVLIGYDYEHIMARAVIFRSPNEVHIEITSVAGDDSQRLAEFLEQVEPIALSFAAIPVRNIREKRENT